MSPVEVSTMLREWLVALINGGDAPWPSGLAYDVPAVVTALQSEGIAVLACQRMSGSKFAFPQALHDALQSAARESAMHSLQLDAETRRVLTVLAQAGLPCLLLKGSALAYWLYDSPALRERVDIDLLLTSRGQAEQAADALLPLGYCLREREIPGDLTTYEITCVREVAGALVELDLHWDIGGAPVFASRITPAELFGESIPLSRLSGDARGPEAVHAFLNAAMHRSLNLHLDGDRLKWLYDFDLLARSFSPAQCRRLIDLSTGRGLAGTCLSALLASQDVFGSAMPAWVTVELREQAALEAIDASRMGEWRYIQRKNLQALPGLGMRVRWLRQRLLPAPGYLQDMYGSPGLRGWSRYLVHGFRKLLSR